MTRKWIEQLYFPLGYFCNVMFWKDLRSQNWHVCPRRVKLSYTNCVGIVLRHSDIFFGSLIPKIQHLLIFSAFFIGKKTLMYSLCPSVCPWANFLANHETHRTKIFSVGPSIHMLESIQIWFISDKAFGLNLKNTLKTEPRKADCMKPRTMKKAPHENYLVILFLLVFEKFTYRGGLRTVPRCPSVISLQHLKTNPFGQVNELFFKENLSPTEHTPLPWSLVRPGISIDSG